MQIRKYISKLLNRISLIGKWTHLFRIRKAKKVLKKLKEINQTPDSNGRIIMYLRKINPFVFEELILSVIENGNTHIIRNKRYTGDGGIDGIFKTKNGKVLIQCKRYKSYINNKDVVALSQLVKTGKYHFGIFVHTGKTGNKSRETIKIENNVLFISGSLLIDLIMGKIHIESHIASKIKKLSLNSQIK